VELGKYLYDLRTFPGDAALAWRREGWSAVWKEILVRTLYRLFRRGHFLVIEQELTAFREVAPPAGVRIARFEVDWSVLAGLATQRERRRMSAIARQGRTCLVAWRGERPVGYTWYSETMDPAIEGIVVPLPEDAAYLWDLYVDPAERGSGVGSALVAARLRHARERGYRTGWRMIAPSNAASLRTLGKTAGKGTRVVGELRYVKLGPRMRMRVTMYDAAAPLPAAAVGGK
jgi:GNAT superfamily N-acetyltransferase